MSNKLLLIDVSIRTMIGLLPSIMNENNKRLCDYISNIYDNNNNSIKLSVDNTMIENSYVKSLKGFFDTVSVNHLIINNDIQNASMLSHNSLGNRYLYSNNDNVISPIPEEDIPYGMNSYAHNAEAIGICLGNTNTALSLTSVINDIYSRIESLPVSRNTIPLSYGLSLSDNNTLCEPNSFTFDESLLFIPKVLLKRMNLPEYQYNDITSGSLYCYYEYNDIVTITDERTASILGFPGSIVKINFNDTLTNDFYRIVLSRELKKYVRLSKDELNRVRLVCTGNDDIYGTIWDILDYSVRSSEDIKLEKNNKV